MNSTFFGLELSRRALESQQVALNITGHNIANANTQGYTRQIANLTATTPDSIPAMGRNLSLGSGVTLDTITRARDAFVDRQFRSETSKQQYWGSKQDSLTKVESILNEPSDNSLSSDMNQFWTAWSDLSKDPENAGARSVVSERAQELTDSFHNIAQQVSDLKENVDASIKVQITQINSYGQQIKDLNDQIKRAEVAGDSPNDLRDQRDSLVDDLSKIVSVRVVETKDTTFADRNVNSYKVIIGNENSTSNNVLVDDSTLNSLDTNPTTDLNGLSGIAWSDSTPVDLGTKLGTLSADLETRNNDIPDFEAQVDALAQGIADAVNALHRTGQGLTIGSGGIDFFTDGTYSTSTPSALPGVTAATITLNSAIETDVNKIATGTTPIDGTTTVTAGDGSIAQAISSLSSGWNALKSLSGFTNTISASSLSDFYAANVAQLGVKVQQADRMKAGEDVLVTNVTNQRESLSGVSLDEEMTNLVKFQKSYSAAARMVTMMDDMLSTIMNMGITK
ncbi:flagellar hook-associated protein FlgK [Desulfosporosinus sp. Sb-LF]|uniref:flagellar hook-associated protein FlgK n=1 Tax=Desulfosporosinus sp. Sb-LF TaxID=2560027 RepID=UPI00107F0889|nr:flagellar hook-associated protein FlgK [Desulfosporosinus sp. Sb-LF]TGE32589.1 flagellar hook-associated protein FlgK [Desulfosporosinus sp. Sb-LF]